ncbi:MAG: metallophosphoesterase [Deltaproteobacteria bacterium]|nr:metallophosphoesterase [Deltaproteobacteria bacterium]
MSFRPALLIALLALPACSGGSSSDGPPADQTDAADAQDSSLSTDGNDAGAHEADAALEAEATTDTSLDAADGDEQEAQAEASTFELCGLLQNGGAESADLAPWQVDAGSWSVVAKDADAGVQPAEGSYFLSAGTEPDASLWQTVALDTVATHLDQGGLFAHLTVQTRVQADGARAWLDLEAFDASKQSLAKASSVPLVNAWWGEGKVGLELPAGTRSLRVGVRVDGAGAPALAHVDGAALCLDSKAPSAEEQLVTGPTLSWPVSDAITVSWELDQPGPALSVAYGPTPALGESTDASAQGHHYQVRLAGLAPDTDYYYRIQGLPYPGELHKFRTAPPSGPAPKPYSFTVWGDNQDGVDAFRGIAAQMAALSPSFMVSAGDQVQDGSEAHYHSQLLAPLSPWAASIPLIGAPGNHNTSGDLLLAQWDQHLPQPDPNCFGLRYANLYLVSVDTNAALAVSLPCLNKIFASSDYKTADLKAAVLHEPPRNDYWAGGSFKGNDFVRLYLEPLFVASGMQVVFTGHVHMYFWAPPADTQGITWVTTGGGGGSLEGPGDKTADWPELDNGVFVFRHHFLRATVQGKSMQVDAIADTGETLHSFTVGTP